MQRKYIRATADGTDRDVPITTFIAGEYLIYDGSAVATSPLPTIITGPSSTVVNEVATWGDTSGSSLLATPVTIDTGGNVASVTTINGTDPSTWVKGPAGADAYNVAAYADNTGKQLYDTGITIDTIVSSTPVFVTAGHLVSYADTTGTLVEDSGIDKATVVQAASVTYTAYYIPMYSDTTGKLLTISPLPVDNVVQCYYTTPGSDAIVISTTSSTQTRFSNVKLSYTGDMTSLVSINGRAVSSFVTGPGSASDNALVRWDGTSGSVIQNSTVIVDDSGNLTGVGTINGIDLTAYTRASGSHTDNAVARWDGALGNWVQSSTVDIDDSGSLSGVLNINGALADHLVTSNTDGTYGQVPIYIGSSRGLYPVPVTIDASGNITNVNGINSVSMGDYSYRNAGSGGASYIAVFDGPDYGSLAQRSILIDSTPNVTGINNLDANNLSCSNINATTINGQPLKTPVANRTGTAVVGSTATTPAGATLTLPSTSDYVARWVIPIALSDTGGNIEVAVSWSSGSATAVVQVGVSALVSSTSGFANSFSTSGAPPIFALTIDLALAGASASSTISVSLRKSSGSAFTVYAGTAFAIQG